MRHGCAERSEFAVEDERENNSLASFPAGEGETISSLEYRKVMFVSEKEKRDMKKNKENNILLFGSIVTVKLTVFLNIRKHF